MGRLVAGGVLEKNVRSRASLRRGVGVMADPPTFFPRSFPFSLLRDRSHTDIRFIGPGDVPSHTALHWRPSSPCNQMYPTRKIEAASGDDEFERWSRELEI